MGSSVLPNAQVLPKMAGLPLCRHRGPRALEIPLYSVIYFPINYGARLVQVKGCLGKVKDLLGSRLCQGCFHEKLTNKLQDCKEYSPYVNSVVYTTG